MGKWLLKTEPDVYSIDDLQREGVAHWEGVRNYVARNNLTAMRVRDLAFVYHSNVPKAGVAGVCEVVKKAYPDHHAWDPDSRYFDRRSRPDRPLWFMPDVRFVEKFPRVVTLGEIKANRRLAKMDLVRFGRLSVQRVTHAQWRAVCEMAHADAQ